MFEINILINLFVVSGLLFKGLGTILNHNGVLKIGA